MKTILIGGSPCTHWSIVRQKKKQNGAREQKAEGIGWELFLNYVIAKEKIKPDYFLYENNESISKEIKQQITDELGIGELMHFNSAKVSAQERESIRQQHYSQPARRQRHNTRGRYRARRITSSSNYAKV